jgi:hypothetical protein
MERDRFDGADVAHLIKACGESLDWSHLLMRFERDWRVLLSQLILFGYIYPGEREVIPAPVMQELMARFNSEPAPDGNVKKLCFGTMLSREQYLFDINKKATATRARDQLAVCRLRRSGAGLQRSNSPVCTLRTYFKAPSRTRFSKSFSAGAADGISGNVLSAKPSSSAFRNRAYSS